MTGVHVPFTVVVKAGFEPVKFRPHGSPRVRQGVPFRINGQVKQDPTFLRLVKTLTDVLNHLRPALLKVSGSGRRVDPEQRCRPIRFVL
jgi:hypothetical protein